MFAAMAAASTLPSDMPMANHKILDVRQGPMIISQELREILESAADAFNAKSYKTAAKYYKTSLHLLTAKDETHQNKIIILIKYMLCMCWLESKDTKDLLDALRNLEDLERTHGCEYPMLYYAVAKSYSKLYRFNKADEILKKAFAVLNGDINVDKYCMPGTNIVIPESSRDRLVASLLKLSEHCSTWHRSDAVCCMPDCSSHSHNEDAEKRIFFGSPTFNGMVQVRCNNTSNFCTMNFHPACWKAKKEQLFPLGKMSDKDVINRECFTPNCENQGVRCTIKKIDIFDENAEVKASIEPRADDLVRHVKPNPQPKGAVRKQQQQHPLKAKSSSAEHRATPYERPARLHSVPNDAPTHNTPAHRTKIEENEEDDDLHDKQALKEAIGRLTELRACNFGIKDDSIWQPDLKMYGNEYMFATAELMPEPDFTNEGADDAGSKEWFFSYFKSFLSGNRPVKLDVLAETWHEVESMVGNCHSVLKHYLDITEFLLQSVKFATVGNYICVAEKLPEAYNLAKNDTCEILRFFMEYDTDQRSNDSSIDDEAVINDLINQEKSNNSSPYLSVSGEAEIINKESSVVSDAPMDVDGTNNEKIISEPEDIKDAAPSPPPAPEIQKTQTSPESDETAQENGQITAPEVVEACKTAEEKKSIVPSELPAAKDVKVETPTEKSVETWPRPVEYPETPLATKTAEPGVKKEFENQRKAPTKAINEVHKIREMEDIVSRLCSPAKPSFGLEKVTQPAETRFKLSLAAGKLTQESKSTNDLRASADSLADIRNILMNNSGEPANSSIKMKTRESSSSPTRPNGVENSENTSDSPDNSECKPDANADAQLLKDTRKLLAKLAQYKEKTQSLESVLEHVKKAHAATRIRMVQKILHVQYASNHSMIMTKMEECRKNYEVCQGIQSILTNSMGQSLPNSGTEEWGKVMSELEQISKNLQAKHRKMNDLYMTKEPENLNDFGLQPESMPDMPQTKLIDLIRAAFEKYQVHLMNKFQQMQISMQPLQPPSMFAGPQYRPPTGDCYTGAHLVQGNPRLPYNVIPPNFMHRFGVQNNIQNFPFCPPQPNMPAYPTAAPTYQVQQIPSAPVQQIPSAPLQQIPSAPLQQIPSAPLQQIPSAPVQQIPSAPVHQHISTTVQQIPSAPVHQHISTTVQQAASKPAPQKVSPYDQIASLAPWSAPASKPHSFIQENGQSSKPKVSLLPQRPNSVADLKNWHKSEQSTAKLSEGRTSFDAPKLPTLLPLQDRPPTPVQKNPTFFPQEQQNFDTLTAKNSQRANSAPETPNVFIAQQPISTPVRINSPAAEIKPLLPYEVHVSYGNIPNANPHENIDVGVTMDPLNDNGVSSTSEKAVEKTNNESEIVDSSSEAAKEVKTRKKPEHSMDKLMRKMREQYNGVLELDLLKAVECVRKKHNNSLSRLPLARIISEADKFIVERQKKQLSGYGKYMPNPHLAVSNAANWGLPNSERRRETSVSSTSSASSLRTEPQHSLPSRKKWAPVVIPNSTWESENSASDCAICFESMENTISYTLTCKHTFHKKCITDWYQRDQICPLCRRHCTIDDEYPPLPVG